MNIFNATKPDMVKIEKYIYIYTHTHIYLSTIKNRTSALTMTQKLPLDYPFCQKHETRQNIRGNLSAKATQHLEKNGNSFGNLLSQLSSLPVDNFVPALQWAAVQGENSSITFQRRQILRSEVVKDIAIW